MCQFFCTAPNHTCYLCNEESRTAYYIAKYHVSPLSPYDEREKSKARNKIFLENYPLYAKYYRKAVEEMEASLAENPSADLTALYYNHIL